MFVINGSCATLIIFITGIFTICCCICSLRIIYKNVALRNAFGLICAIQCLSDAGTAVCSAFWAAPTLLFNSPLSNNIWGFGVGHIMLFFSFFTSWLHLCKSLNRCYAIIMPIQYHKNFTMKNTGRFIAFFAGLAFFCMCSSFILPCNYYFNIENYMWQSRDLECLNTVGKYTDLTTTTAAVIGSVVSDAITLFYLIMFNKRIKHHHGQTLYNEKKFFAQTLCTTFIYVLSGTMSFIGTNNSFSFSVTFLLTTFNWQLFTVFNELIFIVFTMKLKDVTKRFSIFSTSSRVRATATN